MNRFVCRAARVALLLPVGAALFSGAARAADARPPSPTPTPTPVIEDAARTLLGQIAGTYKSAKTYAGTLETTLTGVREKPLTFSVKVAFQRPDKALVRHTDGQGTAAFGADGQTVLVSLPQLKDRYLKTTVPQGVNAVELALSHANGVGPGLDFWLLGKDLLKETEGALLSLKAGQADTVDGVAVDTLLITLMGQTGEVAFAFAAGHDDHLLRRITMDQTSKGQDGTETKVHGEEMHRDVHLDEVMSPSLLKFTPPAGAMPVRSLKPPTCDTRLKPGVAPFKFAARDLAGKPISLEQYKGKVVLLHFWAAWNRPSLWEMPNLLANYHHYHPRGLEIIGISLDRSKAELTAFLKQNAIPWRQVFDGKVYQGAVPKLYGVTGVPLQIVVGRDGKIAAIDARDEEMEAAIDAALAKKAAASASATAKATAVKATGRKRK